MLKKRLEKYIFPMVNGKYEKAQDMINKLQQLKVKTKIKFHQNIRNYYDEMKFRRQSNTFQFKEGSFSKNAEDIIKIYHEVLLLRQFLQTKPLVTNLNKVFYELYYTVFKNRNDKQVITENEYENDKKFINLDDFKVPNHHVGIKPRETK